MLIIRCVQYLPISLTHLQPVFHLWINQVVDFYQQNVWETQMFFKHFTSKSQLPDFHIGTWVKNGLIYTESKRGFWENLKSYAIR